MMLLIGSFHAHLIDQKLRDRQKRHRGFERRTTGVAPAIIPWIEKLLTMSLPDYRKYCIWRILAPYLVNVKKLTDKEAGQIIREWLQKCNLVKRALFDAPSRIRYDIQSVRKRGYYPIGWEQLKAENIDLFKLLRDT